MPILADSLLESTTVRISFRCLIKVLSGSYSAEYGTNSGAQVMIITKSGTNQMHGSLFEFVRNDKFDAEGYFQNYFNSPTAARRPKDKLRQNQFGGVWTGPVWIRNFTTARIRRSSW